MSECDVRVFIWPETLPSIRAWICHKSGEKEGFKKSEKKILNLYPFFQFANETYQPLGVSLFCALVKHVLLRDATAITFYIDCYWYNKSWGSGVRDTLGVLLSK